MRHFWLWVCLVLPLSALELNILSGKSENRPYSILHITDPSTFDCVSQKNEFSREVRTDCTFAHAPITPLPPVDTPFFKVSAQTSAKGYRISIFPKYKMKLFPVPFNLASDPETYSTDKTSSNHWSVVGYTDVMPLVQQDKSEKGINLPVRLNRETMPYVGGLDLKGNPIKIAKVQDVSDYMKLKKAYEAKNYNKVLELADYALKSYPNTIFKNELMLYQIRAHHELGNADKVIDISKRFIREYSSDSNIAEVLAYTADAYGSVGLIVDSDYYFDRLFEEHTDSPYASLGMLYKAKQLTLSGNVTKALQMYQQVLDKTKDIGYASQAAFKMAQLEMEKGETKNARLYIDKIAKANPKYFYEVVEDAAPLASSFADRNDPKTAAKITEALLNEAKEKTPEHEILLRNLGMHLAKAEKNEQALKRFNQYLDEYKYGSYVQEVRKAKDALFFGDEDQNATQLIKKYDDLIERYGNESVGKKALYKKAQALLKAKRYKDVLDIENELYKLDTASYPDSDKLISQSAIGLMKIQLQKKECSEAMKLQKMYKIRLTTQWDESLYECSLRMSRYDVAKTIAERHLKAKNLAEREVWLSRMVDTQFGLGEYKKAIKGGEELALLLETEKNPALNTVYRTLFDAALRTGDTNRMIKNIKAVEKAFPDDFKDIERYTQMVNLGIKRKDDAMVQTYGRKVSALQARTKTYTQSPFVEFTLAQSYQNVGKDADALNALLSLDNRKISAEKRSRQKYLIGSIYLKTGKTALARKAFNESIKADKESAWGKLAKDALGLL